MPLILLLNHHSREAAQNKYVNSGDVHLLLMNKITLKSKGANSQLLTFN